MGIVDAKSYVDKIRGVEKEPQKLTSDSFEDGMGEMLKVGYTNGGGDDSRGIVTEQAMAMQPGMASQYNGYENDGLTFASNMFCDDTVDSMQSFLGRMRLTPNVRDKFVEVYAINASQDNVLTWSNAWLLQRRANMFKLEMLEFKNTLLGPDADSLLFGDFDLVVEIMTARLEARNGRSFEGFERKAGVTNYSYSHNFDNQNMTDTARAKERSGLSRLGKYNPFRGI
jgi:hypothetical protein